MIDHNQRAKEVYEANFKWWHDPVTGVRLERNEGELIMLTVSEVAEAMEGERKDLMDDHLPHRKMAEVELADAKIRILDLCYGFGYELDESVINSEETAIFTDNKGQGLLGIVSLLTHDFYCDLSCEDKGKVFSAVLSLIKAYCVKYGYDLEGAYHDKMAYNATRKDHTYEERMKEGGKKW